MEAKIDSCLDLKVEKREEFVFVNFNIFIDFTSV